jgi:hypothetical protein
MMPLLVRYGALAGLLLAPFVSSAGQDEALRIARAAVAASDNAVGPFAVVDKQQARVLIFHGDGSLAASTPVLLGLARGDMSVPGIGERKISDIKPHERTTTAGRFISEPGRNLSGEHIVWVDYDAAVSMHRVRPVVKAERHLERLATPTRADNRITYDCINVPAAFYDRYVKPALGSRQSAVGRGWSTCCRNRRPVDQSSAL